MLDWLLGRRGRGAARKRRDGEDRPAAEADLFDDELQQRLEYLAIVARRVHSGRTRAERRSKKTGSGIEFADHRPYEPGDDFRHLDWPVYGRTGRLLLRLFEEEEDLSVYLLLDASRSMAFGSPSKLDYGKKLVAALGYVALASLDRVSVLAFNDHITARLPPTRGKNRIFGVFELLRGVHAEGPTALGEAMKTFVSQHKRRGVAILVSDLYDPVSFETGINALRFAKFEPYVIQVFDPGEVRPRILGDVRLVDDETGESREITVTPKILAEYARAHAAYRKRIEDFCTQKQVPYLAVDTSTPFDDAVLKLLRLGGVVG